MKINPNIKNKRLAQMRELYDLITKDNENSKENLYKIIKETINENKDILEESLTNLIYGSLENSLSITLTHARQMYKSFDENKIINLKDLLYSKDGKTLEERIHGWMTEENVMNLFYHLCLILDTETFQIIHQTIKEKVNVDYVEIVGDGGCDTCADYCDGEVYKEEEIELPPYHPGCMCEVIYYEKEDVLGEL